MSDMSHGPGWWQATDGKWYPPGSRPGSAPAAGASPFGGGGAAASPTGGPGASPAGGYGIPPSGGYGPAGGPSAADTKGFVPSLYDFRFDHFVTPKVLRFFYALLVILWSIGAVLTLVVSLARIARGGEPVVTLALLIIVPVFYLVQVVVTRMFFELVSAQFRIADDLRAIRRGKGL